MSRGQERRAQPSRKRKPAAAVRFAPQNSATPLSDSESLANQRLAIANFCRAVGEQIRGKTVTRSVSASEPPATRDDRLIGLTPRVLQTLERMLAGDSEKQIALNLAVSHHTVHIYVKALYRHFQVNSRGELLSFFVRASLPARANNP